MTSTVEIINPKKEVIKGILKENHASGQMILICNGYKSSHTHPAITAIANQLYKKGYTVFTFNFSKRAQTINVEQQVNDLETIITHFSQYKDFTVLGGSFGALSATIGAINLKPINKHITINGFFGTNELLHKTKRMFTLLTFAANFIPQYKKPLTYIKRELQPLLVSVPTLVIFAEDDEIIQSIQSKRFFRDLKNKKHIHPLKNADHHLTNAYAVEEVVDVINSWIVRTGT